MTDQPEQMQPAEPEFSREQCSSARKYGAAFAEQIESLRPELFRYCRGLTGNLWDADDLAQETVFKALGKLGVMAGHAIENPRAYLFRMATNTWIDSLRRAKRSTQLDPEIEAQLEDGEMDSDSHLIEEALIDLATSLPPQERVSVLLKDVFALELTDIARYLKTSVGAVKAALHRGRSRLEERREAGHAGRSAIKRNAMGTTLQRAFVQAFNARDIDGLMALFAEHASAEIPGVLDEQGRDAIRKGSIAHTLFEYVDGQPKALHPDQGRAELVEVDGEVVMLLWYPLERTDPTSPAGVGDVIRIVEADGVITHMSYYYFSPDLLGDIAARMGEKLRSNGYRYVGHAS